MFRLLLPLFLLAFNPAIAQRLGKDYAVFFVADTFDNGWGKLPDIPSETTMLASDLRDGYGFDVRIISRASRADILRTLGEYKKKVYGPDDQLLLFFSMHGFHDPGSDKGYLIPKDGLYDDPTYDSWIAHSQLSEIAASINCRHILVSLDACYSGIFGQNRNRPVAAPWEVSLDDCTTKIKKAFQTGITRKYCAAGGDTHVPAKSSFTEQWHKALQSNANLDGILSFASLSAYLSELRDPQPVWGDFVRSSTGDFVFVKKNACASVAIPTIKDGQTARDPEIATWESVKKQNTESAYQYYLTIYPEGRYHNSALVLRDSFQEVRAWKVAQQQNTQAAYKAYLDTYPSGKYLVEAENKITKVDNFVLIKGGTFEMGTTTASPNEKPVHLVSISDFYLSKYEVTLEDFKAFINETKYKTDAEKDGFSTVYDGIAENEKTGINWQHDAQGNLVSKDDYKHPVVHVSWNDANEYCKWMSKKMNQTYRLPTEAEWEYAAGNGVRHTKYSWGNSELLGRQGGNAADKTAKKKFTSWKYFADYTDGFAITAPVGSFSPSLLGLYDMSGNVQEWCMDWYSAVYYKNSPLSNPICPSKGTEHIIRGGAWSNTHYDCRITSRNFKESASRNHSIGFRIVRTVN